MEMERSLQAINVCGAETTAYHRVTGQGLGTPINRDL
ncbi:unnamed protein product [Tetraodon nigroviridis]|uniref:(spotted green pufferfish) hypothetical protein n=1 Tax=Tetraodon nigroviridis TaxID=99883 RepID=Q4RR14_TETNG|nr:unnamed protein product [Tetraodon nigroviridis]